MKQSLLAVTLTASLCACASPAANIEDAITHAWRCSNNIELIEFIDGSGSVVTFGQSLPAVMKMDGIDKRWDFNLKGQWYQNAIILQPDQRSAGYYEADLNRKGVIKVVQYLTCEKIK